MKQLEQYLKELENLEKVNLFEHEIYKLIPGTKNSYRTDAGDTNTLTLKHSHVYAKPKGGGGGLYSVNLDGTGHDGSSGKEIPMAHADHFRSHGYKIKSNNILENLDIGNINNSEYELVLLEKA